MMVNVRFSAGLAPLVGNTRLQVNLDDQATLADLLTHLCRQYPDLKQKLNSAVFMAAGRHLSPVDPLTSEQEVALLLPVAGG